MARFGAMILNDEEGQKPRGTRHVQLEVSQSCGVSKHP